VGTDKTQDTEAKIEESQRALRKSIAQTKRLTQELDRIVQQNRPDPKLGDRGGGR
jgi:hypothetical protein